MPTIEQDQLARIDTLILWQPFVERVNTALNAAAARGFRYIATNGHRGYEEQDKLYAIGRTTGKFGHVVTKARGGQSNHQFYCASDFALDGSDAPGLQPDYDDARYECLAQEAVRAGLEAGFYWKFKDTPHVQAPIGKWGLSVRDLDAAFRAGGRDKVIALLDSAARW